jgi:hypothetical protein
MAPRTLKSVASEMVSKMECLWKPAQSGKTRTIQEMIRADDGVRKHLNVVICSKNRLLVAQTRERMQSDLYAVIDDSLSTESEETVADDTVVGGVYSWMSGTKRTNITVRDLAWRIFRNEVSMVVCCSHKARFRYLCALLDELEAVPHTKPVNVWIDEADASVNLWTKPEFDFAKYECVRKITLVSATFDEVFKFYSRIRVKAFPETHPACYRGLKDCEIKVEKNGMSPADYLASILEKHPELTSPGVRLFAPGAITVDSHNEVADVLVRYGFAFLILNGKEKAFWLPDGSRHDVVLSAGAEGNPDELSRIVAEKYVELGLENHPFAVTGHLCLSRGITFQSRDFLFDAGVLPDIPDAAGAYQCVARVLGNVGSFSEIKPVVYMSEDMKVATTRQERIAVNLARLVHENEWADVGKEEVERAAHNSEEEYRVAREKTDRDAEEAALAERETKLERSREYTSLEELRVDRKGKLPSAMENGYYRNVTGSKKPMSRAEFEAWVVNKTAQGHHRLERGDETSRVVVFYEDVTDPSTARFVVRTLRRSDPGAVGPAAAGGLPA